MSWNKNVLVGLRGLLSNSAFMLRLAELHDRLVTEEMKRLEKDLDVATRVDIRYEGSRARPNLQRPRRLSKQQVDVLVSEYVDGSSVMALASSFGVHRTTVMSHLERRGVPRRSPVRALTDDQVKEAAKYRSQGESLETVAARFGVSARTIGREFEKAQ